MSLRLKIIILTLLVIIPPIWFLVDLAVNDLKPEYRKATEEPLVDIANILATLLANSIAGQNTITTELLENSLKNIKEHKIKALIYDHLKEQIDLRVYVTDQAGILLYDSFNIDPLGTDYSNWRDIKLTLAGQYGARTTKDNQIYSTLYVAAPIMKGNKLVGVLSVGKPSVAVNLFVEKAKSKITFVSFSIAAITIIFGVILTYLITAPIAELRSYVLAIKAGERPRSPKFRTVELAALSEAVESMSSELDGKKYIENYVLNLTHEIKSPVAAIQGAAELLEEDPEQEQKLRFITNIKEEAKRIACLLEKLLLLSRIEAQKYIKDLNQVNLKVLLEDIIASFNPILKQKNITLRIICESNIEVATDEFLLRHAILNLIQNAIDFSPTAGSITCSITAEIDQVILKVIDQGVGTPDYATTKIFERFYSLARPDGRKSSGLGLSLVREVMSLMDGSVDVKNSMGVGVEAELRFARVGLAP